MYDPLKMTLSRCLFLHFYSQFAAVHYVGVGDLIIHECLAVELHGAYVFLLRRVAGNIDGECLAVGEMQRGLAEHGTSDSV